MEKLISIIIPVYNAEEYLPQNIESILQQDYSNIELILVNDGSTDNSLEVMKKYQNNDSRIIILNQKNSGAPTARNYGLDYSKGHYIQFVDSDDVMVEGALTKMVVEAEKENADIVIGAYDTVNENQAPIEKVPLPLSAGVYDLETYRSDFSLIPPMPGNKLLKATMIKDNNLSFTPTLKQAQDLNFYLKSLLFAKKIVVIDDVVYHYRIRSGSISHTYSLVILEVINSINNAEQFYKENKFFYKELFTNIRFFHYSFQLQKVPQINSKADRKIALNKFKKEFDNLERNDLFSKFKGKKYIINYSKLIFGPLFISGFYADFQRSKAKKAQKEQ